MGSLGHLTPDDSQLALSNANTAHAQSPPMDIDQNISATKIAEQTADSDDVVMEQVEATGEGDRSIAGERRAPSPQETVGQERSSPTPKATPISHSKSMSEKGDDDYEPAATASLSESAVHHSELEQLEGPYIHQQEPSPPPALLGRTIPVDSGKGGSALTAITIEEMQQPSGDVSDATYLKERVPESLPNGSAAFAGLAEPSEFDFTATPRPPLTSVERPPIEPIQFGAAVVLSLHPGLPPGQTIIIDFEVAQQVKLKVDIWEARNEPET